MARCFEARLTEGFDLLMAAHPDDAGGSEYDAMALLESIDEANKEKWDALLGWTELVPPPDAI